MSFHNLQNMIDKGLTWLTASGIQNTTDDEVKGGYSAWYDVNKRDYAFIYSEITGYALNLLIAYAKIKKSDKITESIHLASNFLTEIAFDKSYKAIRCRYEPGKGWLENFCTFDNAIVANALINKYKFDSDPHALTIAKEIIETLMTKLSFENSCYARYIKNEDRFQNDKIKWSTCFGSFHAKLAIPLYNIYSLTKDKKYLVFIESLLNKTKAFQVPQGKFITSERNKTTFLHPHFYTVEGYIAANKILGQEYHSELINKSLSWASKLRLREGGICGFVGHNKNIDLDSPDINSQFLRCLILSNNESLFDTNHLVSRILSYQQKNKNCSEIDGGFKIGDIWFLDHEKLIMREKKNHINTWATIFALNALYYVTTENRDPFTLC